MTYFKQIIQDQDQVMDRVYRVAPADDTQIYTQHPTRLRIQVRNLVQNPAWAQLQGRIKNKIYNQIYDQGR